MSQSATNPLISNAKLRRELADLNEATEMARQMRQAHAKEGCACVASPELVAAIVCVDVATLRRARERREANLKEGVPLDPHHVSSMRPSNQPEGSRSVAYPCSEVLDFLDRRCAEIKKSVNARNLPAKAIAAATRGFSSFLTQGDALSTWPFALQPDGRPVDLAEALEIGIADGPIERLTVAQFGSKLAAAASQAFHEGEREALGETLDIDKPDETGEPRDRWEESGGPL